MSFVSLRSVVFAVFSLALLACASAHAEKRKLTGTARLVAGPTQTVPWSNANAPKREITQRVSIFHWFSSNADWDGIVETSPQQTLAVDGNDHDVGHIVFHFKNGDEAWGYFIGTSKLIVKGETWELPFEGDKILTGGTGKFANIKGTLRYKGKATPAGVLFSWDGELDY